MEDAEDSLISAFKLHSVLLTLLGLIFDCALSIVKAGLKLAVSISLCNIFGLHGDFSKSITLSSRYHPDYRYPAGTLIHELCPDHLVDDE